jgi:hypothetical protein
MLKVSKSGISYFVDADAATAQIHFCADAIASHVRNIDRAGTLPLCRCLAH